MTAPLPQSVRATASLEGNELAWPIADFLRALEEAAAAGLACLGGQFQFRFPDGICEMYWLNADSVDRQPSESWPAYVARSSKEVKAAFERNLAETDFLKEASNWPFVAEKAGAGVNPLDHLCFCAYFVSENDGA